MADESMIAGGDSPLVYPTNDYRASYNETIQMLADEFNDPSYRFLEKLAILPGELRMEVELPASTTNSFGWEVRVNIPNPGMTTVRTTENRLDINDLFAVRECCVFFGLQTDALPLASQMKLYANEAPNVFLPAGASVAVGQAYNGNLSMKNNTTNYLDKLGMSVFRNVDLVQEGLSFGAAAPNLVDMQSWNKDQFFQFIPQFIMGGNDKTDFEVRIPDVANFTATTAKVVAVLILRGLKIQNGATYRAANN